MRPQVLCASRRCSRRSPPGEVDGALSEWRGLCPASADTPNTQSLSGFSPTLIKLVLSGTDVVGDEEEVEQPDGSIKMVKSGPTPKQTLRKALDDEAFASSSQS